MVRQKDIVTPWGGLSTEHEVKELMAAFPELKPGDLVSHADVERTIECVLGTSRYRTCTHASRRRLLAEVMTSNQKQLASDYRTPPALPRAAAKG